MYNPKQGDIVFLDFSPQSEHEQAGRRLGVIISNEQPQGGRHLHEH